MVIDHRSLSRVYENKRATYKRSQETEREREREIEIKIKERAGISINYNLQPGPLMNYSGRPF